MVFLIIFFFYYSFHDITNSISLIFHWFVYLLFTFIFIILVLHFQPLSSNIHIVYTKNGKKIITLQIFIFVCWQVCNIYYIFDYNIIQPLLSNISLQVYSLSFVCAGISFVLSNHIIFAPVKNFSINIRSFFVWRHFHFSLFTGQQNYLSKSKQPYLKMYVPIVRIRGGFMG